MDAVEVIRFWFEEVEPRQQWAKDPTFDDEIRRRFTRLHAAAGAGELWAWRHHALGRLAEIIVLDQFSRNIFRDDVKAFAWDGQALVLAQEAITAGVNYLLPPERRAFLYMPFMHSESPLIHERAVAYFSEPGLEYHLDFELRHKAIIDRFRRYPHRNVVLGRESTPAELEFLAGPGSSF